MIEILKTARLVHRTLVLLTAYFTVSSVNAYFFPGEKGETVSRILGFELQLDTLLVAGTLALLAIMWMLAGHLRLLVHTTALSQNHLARQSHDLFETAKAYREDAEAGRRAVQLPNLDDFECQRTEEQINQWFRDMEVNANDNESKKYLSTLQEYRERYKEYALRGTRPEDELQHVQEYPWVMLFPGGVATCWAFVSSVVLPVAFVGLAAFIAIPLPDLKTGAPYYTLLPSLLVVVFISINLLRAVSATRRLILRSTWFPKHAPFDPFPVHRRYLGSTR